MSDVAGLTTHGCGTGYWMWLNPDDLAKHLYFGVLPWKKQELAIFYNDTCCSSLPLINSRAISLVIEKDIYGGYVHSGRSWKLCRTITLLSCSIPQVLSQVKLCHNRQGFRTPSASSEGAWLHINKNHGSLLEYPLGLAL